MGAYPYEPLTPPLSVNFAKKNKENVIGSSASHWALWLLNLVPCGFTRPYIDLPEKRTSEMSKNKSFTRPRNRNPCQLLVSESPAATYLISVEKVTSKYLLVFHDRGNFLHVQIPRSAFHVSRCSVHSCIFGFHLTCCLD